MDIHCTVITCHADAELSEKIRDALVAEDIRPVFVMENVDAEEDRVPERIRRLVDESLFVLIAITDESERFASLRAVIKYAFSTKKMLLPYKTHRRKLSFGLQLMLGQTHWLDVSTFEDPDEGIEELRRVAAIHRKNFVEAEEKKRKEKFRRAAFALAGTLAFIALVVLLPWCFSSSETQNFGRGVALVSESGDVPAKAPELVPARTPSALPATPPPVPAPPAPVPAKQASPEELREFEKIPLLADCGNGVTMEFVRIPGSGEAFLGKTEVTQAQWRAVMGDNPSFSRGDALPVENVSYADAEKFCEKLTALLRSREERFRNLKMKFALPSSTQWLAMAPMPKSPDEYRNRGWIRVNSGGRTHPVATKPATETGFHDMIGNVWEWVVAPDDSDEAKFFGMGFNGDVPENRGYVYSSAAKTKRFDDVGFRVAFVPDDGVVSAETPESVPAPQLSPEELRELEEIPTLTDCGSGVKMEFVRIPAGTFTMGTPESEEGRETYESQVNVTISRPFALGKYEVTQAQWRAVMGNNPSRYEGDNLPVECVSWDDANTFFEKLTSRDRASGRLPKNMKYALPTEAQWEYACRAGTATRFYTGSSESDLARAAWYYENSGGKTCPVGQKAPNAWGLYDMHGNVREWCADYYDPDLSEGADPCRTIPGSGTYGRHRVCRGGSWLDPVRKCPSAFRTQYLPNACSTTLGFRAAIVYDVPLGTDSAEIAPAAPQEPPRRVVVGEFVRALFPRGVASVADALKSAKPETFAPTFPGRAFFIYRFRNVYDAASGGMRLLPDPEAMREFFYANKDIVIPVNDLAASSVAVLRELPSRKNAGLAVPALFPAALPQIDPKADFAVVSYGGEVFAKGEFSAELLNPASRDAFFKKIGDALQRASSESSESAPAAGGLPLLADCGNGVKMEFVRIPAGTFTMGSPESEDNRYEDELQVHVTISRPFALGKYEVTQTQWKAVMKNNPSVFKGGNLPVENVSWDDANAFCEMLTSRERAAGRLPANMKYALPTEAQWEYACRAGTTTRFCSGEHESDLDRIAWYYKNSGRKTHPIGRKKPNAWGLYDMHGNVREWCADYYDSELIAGTDPCRTTPGTEGTERVCRGGGLDSSLGECRSAYRYRQSVSEESLGFRVAVVEE